MKISTTILVFLFVFSEANYSSGEKKNLECSGEPHYNVTLTAYYPDFTSDLTSDYLDMKEEKLQNLQDYVDERGEFVTAAMDIIPQLPYGSRICIPELNKHYNRPIEIQVRDYSIDLKGQGYEMIEICVRSEGDSYDNSVNRQVTLYT